MSEEEEHILNKIGEIIHPLLPGISITEMGMTRRVAGKTIFVTPFPSSGFCNKEIKDSILKVMPGYNVEWQQEPPYSTDWMTAQGAEKLMQNGIAPPNAKQQVCSQELFLPNEAVNCVYCKSLLTEKLKGTINGILQTYHCSSCGRDFLYFVPQ